MDAAVGFVFVGEAVFHFGFGVEGFDDAEPGEGFFHEGEDFAHFGLPFIGAALEVFAYTADEPSHDGEEDEDEKGELPAHEEHHGEVNEDEDGVLEEHVKGAHDGGFDFLDVAGHAGDDVSFAFFGEEGKGKGEDFEVDFAADVAHDAVAYEDEFVGTEIGEAGFEGSGDDGDAADEDEGGGGTVFVFDLGDVVVEELFDGVGVQGEGHFLRDILLAAEDDAKDGDEHGNGEAAEDGVEEVVEYTFGYPHFIGRDEAAKDG